MQQRDRVREQLLRVLSRVGLDPQAGQDHVLLVPLGERALSRRDVDAEGRPPLIRDRPSVVSDDHCDDDEIDAQRSPDPPIDMHPTEVVPVQVAEENVATRGQVQGKRPQRPGVDLVELSDPVQPIFVHAQPVGTEGQSVRREIRPHDHELVCGGRLVVDLEDNVTAGHGRRGRVDVEVSKGDVDDFAFRLRRTGTCGGHEQAEEAYREAEADPMLAVLIHGELHASGRPVCSSGSRPFGLRKPAVARGIRERASS